QREIQTTPFSTDSEWEYTPEKTHLQAVCLASWSIVSKVTDKVQLGSVQSCNRESSVVQTELEARRTQQQTQEATAEASELEPWKITDEGRTGHQEDTA
ncbi:hypothetical protein STEG23_022431, partial [Scotinomys teguina]